MRLPKQRHWRLSGGMLRIRFKQAGVIEPMQAAQVASFMNSWRDTFARTEDRAGTAGLFPLAALRFSVARVDFAAVPAGRRCRLTGNPIANRITVVHDRLLATLQRHSQVGIRRPEAVGRTFTEAPKG
jgi:hypothetical protein